MKKEVFDDCYENWIKPTGDPTKVSWQTKAIKWGYGIDGSERVRCDFKADRKKQGITKDISGSIQTDRPVLKNPIVGVCDIETLPAEVYTFQLYDQNIGIEQVKHPTTLLGWAGKFLNDSNMNADIMNVKEAPKRDAFRITKSCWEFLSQCDVVIGHNWNSFDGKILNTMFLKYNLPPLKYVTVDTLMVSKANFRFDSNKMAYINRVLGIRNKISNEGFLLWKRCVEGEADALEEMKNYNIGDIYATEELYYRVRPYVRNFNVALYNEIDKHQCPVCGGTSLSDNGYYYTSAGKYNSVRCDECGCLSRKKDNLLGKYKKKQLLINS